MTRTRPTSPEEIRKAFEHFHEIWEELDLEARQYAVRLLVKDNQVDFETVEKQGEVSIQA